MKVIFNDTEKRCEIWVFNSEKATYKQDKVYLDAVAQAEELNYMLCTFLSGQDELLPIMHQILNDHHYTLPKVS